MIRQCAWCETVLGEKEPYNDRSVTHTVCVVCLADILEYDQTVRVSLRVESENQSSAKTDLELVKKL